MGSEMCIRDSLFRFLLVHARRATHAARKVEPRPCAVELRPRGAVAAHGKKCRCVRAGGSVPRTAPTFALSLVSCASSLGSASRRVAGVCARRSTCVRASSVVARIVTDKTRADLVSVSFTFLRSFTITRRARVENTAPLLPHAPTRLCGVSLSRSPRERDTSKRHKTPKNTAPAPVSYTHLRSPRDS